METLHILSATLLLGGSLVIAIIMRNAKRAQTGTESAALIGAATRAELVLVLPAVVVQPATGLYEAAEYNLPMLGGWVGLSLLLYVIGALAWISGLRLSFGMKALAAAAGPNALPEDLRRQAGLWQALRGVWLTALLAMLYIMINVREI